MYITVKNVTKRFDGQTVLDDVSLELEKGGKYGIVGQNGCGKTMLLRAICGFLRPDEGMVYVNEELIGSKEYEFIKETGAVIGETTFQNSLTGYENLKILADIKKKIADSEIDAVLERVGLYKDRNKLFGEYSMGMKQRLRIAQAIMEKPQLLILDEPFNGLDKNGVCEIREMLKEYLHSDITLLLTSHNEVDIKMLCNTVIEMDNGKVIDIR